MFGKPIDILAIGDTTIDAFIRLKDAKTHCSINNENCELCVRFGDKVPYEFVEVIPAVGNSANAAVSCARLGLNAGLLASVGDDQNGELCIKTLKGEGVDTRYMRKEKGIPTNYHYVLWYEDERTILIKQNAYPLSLPTGMREPRWIYLSSLGEHAIQYHDEIGAYLEAHPNVKLAFQPGTFQMKMGAEKLKKIYEHTEIFFCNKEEAQRILGTQSTDIKELLAGMRTLGPRIVVITDGRKGLCASDGTNHYRLPMYPDRKPPVERTGAGDATASAITAALCLNVELKDALRWGPINGMAVVEEIGAQRGLLRREALIQLLVNAPNDYRITPL